ncbi:MAG: hypothetical protein JEY94_16000 [Melioribacteraceae bacterium]|nr:hypothetical protein [Melioribacteraceae bacterium]
MPEQNKVSIEIPPEILDELEESVKNISEKLKPYLIALTPEERRAIPKMSDKSVPFVEKALSYAEDSSEFTPVYLKVDEMKIDVKAVNDLNRIFKPITQIYSNLDDTIMYSGSEAFQSALSYYKSVKMAADMDIPNAKTVYEDLSKRFANRSKKDKS